MSPSLYFRLLLLKLPVVYRGQSSSQLQNQLQLLNIFERQVSITMEAADVFRRQFIDFLHENDTNAALPGVVESLHGTVYRKTL